MLNTENLSASTPQEELKQTDEFFLKSADLVAHPVGEMTAVYHKKLGGLCLLDAPAMEVLESFSLPQSLPENSPGRSTIQDRLVEQLLARGFLENVVRDDAGAVRAPAAMPRINVIQLVMVNSCNFGCTYCFEGLQGSDLVRSLAKKKDDSTSEARRDLRKVEVAVNLLDSVYASEERRIHQTDPENRLMTPELAVEYVEITLGLAKKAGVENVMIQFFGGEPLLNKAAILAVLGKIGNGEQYGIEVEYTTVTNGSLVNDEIAKAFAEHRVGVCVSFDSIDSTSRPLKNGKSSTPAVLEGLSKLREYNNRIALNAALCANTFDTVNSDLIEFAASHGIHEIGIVLDLDPKFYSQFGGDKIAEKVADLVEFGKAHGVVVTGYWHQIFQLLSAFDAVRYRGFKNCSAKGAQFSIEPNGAVFSCKAGSGYFGNIREGEDVLVSETFQAHAALQFENPAYCKGCEIEGFCAGICLGPLEKKFQTVDAVEFDACDTYRQVARKLIQAVEPGEVPTFRLAKSECVSM